MRTNTDRGGIVGRGQLTGGRRRLVKRRSAVAAAARSPWVAKGAVVALAATGMWAQHASAANKFWNVSSGFYDVAANWAPTGTPTAASTVYIENGGTAIAGGNGITSFASGDLYVSNAASGTLQMTTGTFLVTGAVRVGAAATGTGVGSLQLTGGLFNVSNFVSIGVGNSNLNGMTMAAGATMNVSAGFNVADTNKSVGVLTMTGGTVNTTSMFVGKSGNATGIVNQTDGTVNISGSADSFVIGGNGTAATTAVGIYNLGGTATFATNSAIDVALYGTGQLNVTGGVIQENGGSFQIAHTSANGYGVIDASGGVLNQNATGKQFIVGDNGTGVLNVRGSAVVNLASTNKTNALLIGGAATATGIVNLMPGGTVNTASVGGTAGANSILNFNGGTLATTANSAASGFTFVSGLKSAFVYAGGAVIDTSAGSGTIAQTLSAPTGNGINSIAATASGSGYQAPPIVQIVNDPSDTTGSGATAVATLSGGNLTFTITNPGTGYTAAPQVKLISGLAGTGATATATIAPNAAPGLLTKNGPNALTLSPTAANGFGGTQVNGGTLIAGNAFALPAGTPLTVAAGAGVNFNGSYAAAPLSLSSLSTTGGAMFGFNASSAGVDAVTFTAPSTVSGSNTIAIAAPPGTMLTPGTYNLLSDALGGLGANTFTLATPTITVGGLQYPLTLSSTNTLDALTIGTGVVAKLYYIGGAAGGGTDLNTAGNYSSDPGGSPSVALLPNAITDVVFSAGGNVANATPSTSGPFTANSLEFSSAAPVTLSGTGVITLSAAANTFAAGTAVVLDANAGGATITAPLALPAAATMVNNSASTLTLGGTISSPAATNVTYTATGTGGFDVSGTNTYAGTTTLSPSTTVRLLSAGALGATTNTVTLLANPGTGAVGGGNNPSPTFSVLDVNGQSVTLATLNLNGGRVVDSANTGSLTLNGDANGLAIQINAPALTYAGTALATPFVSVPKVNLPNGGVILKPTNVGYMIVGSDVNLSSGSATVNNTTVSLVNTGNLAADLLLLGTISGNGSLTVADNVTVPGVTLQNTSDAGSLGLAGNNTYTGGTFINYGRVVINGNAAFGTGPVTIGANGTLAIGAISYNTSSPLFSTMNVTGLNVTNPINLGGSTGGTYSAGITNNTGSNTLSGNVALTQPTAVVSTTANTTLTLSGVIAGTAAGNGMNKSGAGTLILTNANTYTGPTGISAGTLQLGDGTAGHDGTISGTSAVTDNGTLVFNHVGPDTTLYAIGGTGAVVIAGTGVVTFATPNPFTGALTINAGATLQQGDGTTGHDGRTNSTSGVTNNGILAFNRFATGPTAPYNISGSGVVTMAGVGAQTLSGNNSYTGGTTVNGGTLTAASANAFGTGTLTVNADAKAAVANPATGRRVLALSNLAVNGTGQVDVASNDLDVTGSNLAAVNTLVAAGFAGGTWNGSGGIGSSTASADALHLTGVGVIQNTAALFGDGTTAPKFDGATVGAADVLVKYTYYGDANLDGVVNGADYTLVDAGFASAKTGWFNGDFNYDGVVDGSDYTLMDNAFNQQSAVLASAIVAAPAASLFAAPSAQVAAVPEPTGLLLLAVAAPAGLLGRRRRRAMVAGQI